MTKIRLDFSEIFTALLKSLKINLIAFPVYDYFKLGENKYFEALKKDYSAKEAVISLPSSVDSYGEINVDKTTYLIFSEKAFNELEGEDAERSILLLNRPENLLLVWQIVCNGVDFLIYKEVRRVDHHIIRIKGHDSKQGEDKTS